MAIIIPMPKLSDTMEEGGVASWLKKEGDFVEEGSPLLEIETDKATMEYVSPEEGVLLKILAPKGTTVNLGSPIAVLGKKGEAFDPVMLNKAPAPSEKAPTAQASVPAVGATSTPPQQAAPQSTGRIKASPLAKKLAKEKGVNLGALSGSGPGGRIVAKDLDAVAVASMPSLVVGARRESRKIPHTMMRKTIAKRLLAAKNDAPHFYLTTSIRMDEVLQWRKDLNAHPGVEKGRLPSVSVNDLIVLAVSRALRDHPQVNSSWQEDAILEHGFVDVSVAVALPTGLITPVIANADHLGAREIATQSKELVKRAKEGTLKPEEYQGGTFTVSNLGMTCVESFTAIINPPQACILAVGNTQRVPVVKDKDELVIESRMNVTLSCDHRVVDGMVGAQFLETLKRYLEKPVNMLA